MYINPNNQKSYNPILNQNMWFDNQPGVIKVGILIGCEKGNILAI
jgi:hypothetical protein